MVPRTSTQGKGYGYCHTCPDVQVTQLLQAHGPPPLAPDSACGWPTHLPCTTTSSRPPLTRAFGHWHTPQVWAFPNTAGLQESVLLPPPDCHQRVRSGPHPSPKAMSTNTVIFPLVPLSPSEDHILFQPTQNLPANQRIFQISGRESVTI